jgi:hypothetical protein
MPHGRKVTESIVNNITNQQGMQKNEQNRENVVNAKSNTGHK